jgi:spermidine synthase
MTCSVKSTVFDAKTEFQQVTILDTDVYGKALLLDGHIQLTDFDEKAYHEALVQIPAVNLPSFSKALVIGGGDGGVIRELCRHASVSQIDMVEIDKGVVDACSEHMPNLSNGAFQDPRVRLHITDAFGWVKSATDSYDLIVVDSTDTYEDEEGEISEMLWTSGFYSDLLRLLSPNGFVVTQADNHVYCPYSSEDVLDLFGQVFPAKGFYFALVPSFGGFSGFVWGSKGAAPATKWSPSFDKGWTTLNESTYNLAFSDLKF